jgi:WD40 repeat protein
MIASAIRELAASRNPSWVAAACFERTIQIWDMEQQKKLNDVSTVFCGGARNLAVAPLANMLVAGTSVDGKVAGYELPSGDMLWEVGFDCPSSLRFHPSGESILCTKDRHSVCRLDVTSGTILDVLEGVSHYIEGLTGDVFTVRVKKGGKSFHFITKDQSFEITRAGFALLDVQFSPYGLCLSEARGPVRFLSRVDGLVQWQFHPGTDSHVTKLHYSPTMGAFFGVLRDLTRKQVTRLVSLDAVTGASTFVCDLDSWEEVFLDRDQLITSNGEIRDLASGARIGQLSFPMREYPHELDILRSH